MTSRRDVIEKALQEYLFSFKKDPIFISVVTDNILITKGSVCHNKDYLIDIQISPDYNCFTKSFIKENLSLDNLSSDRKKALIEFVTLSKVKFLSEAFIKREYLSPKFISRLDKFIERIQKRPETNAEVPVVDIIPIVVRAIEKLENDFLDSNEYLMELFNN